MTLAEKKLPWENHHLDLRAGDQQQPDYLKLNPNAVVPTLVDDGRVIIESTVICEYLYDAYPSPSMRPAPAAARAQMRRWTKQLDETIHAATSVISNGIAFRHQKLVWGMERLKEFHRQMPDAARRERSWENITKGIESRYFPDALKRFDKLLSDMEATLTEAPWLAGEEYSLADISYAPYITRLENLQLQFMWDRRPHIPTWFDRLRERSSYVEAFDRWRNPSYEKLMMETGTETRARIKTIIAGS
jgi:glutathione S-transferase